MTKEQVIDEYVDEHKACRWMDAGELREVLTNFAKDLGWHSVEESLPEVGEDVIVLTDVVRGVKIKAPSLICFAHIVDKELAMDWDGWNIPGVRYWMPCPELPEDAR